MLNQDQIQGKWTEIKGGIRNLWGQITDDELEQTKGNIGAVSGIVQQKYGETKDSIKQKLDSLMDTFDNETDKSMKVNDGISSFERNPTGFRTSSTSQVQDANSDISTRSTERKIFEQSKGGAINAKQGIAGFPDDKPTASSNGSGLSTGAGTTNSKNSSVHDLDLGKEDLGSRDYDTEEIFDDGDQEAPTYEPREQTLNKSHFNNSEDRIARH